MRRRGMRGQWFDILILAYIVLSVLALVTVGILSGLGVIR